MPINAENVLSLLKDKLATLDLNVSERSTVVEKKLADELFNTIKSFDKEDSYFCEDEEELYESTCKLEEVDVIYEPFYDQNENNYFSYEYVCNVLDYKEKNPKHSRVKYSSYLSRFREYRDNLGKKKEKLILIANHCKESFDNARQNGAIVHDRTIKCWALAKARKLKFDDFKASSWWINKFKHVYKISSRKIVKFVTFKQNSNLEETENQVVELLLHFQDHVLRNYEPYEVLNFDQSGFNYQHLGNRTLSYTGERSTIVRVEGQNYLGHSYTIQPVMTLAGTLLSPLYINLQEIGNEFGPRVIESLPNYQNLYITCSTSGKLTTNLIRRCFDNVLKYMVDERAVLYVDSWAGHNNNSLYQIEGKNIDIKIFPKGSTGFVQPLDLNCFHQWKDFVKRITEQIMIENLDMQIHHRANVLEMHSLILNQFQNVEFKPMWLYCWRAGGFEVPEMPFRSLKEILFSFDDTQCKTNNCINSPFICCIYCKQCLCFTCFFVNYHYHYH